MEGKKKNLYTLQDSCELKMTFSEALFIGLEFGPRSESRPCFRSFSKGEVQTVNNPAIHYISRVPEYHRKKDRSQQEKRSRRINITQVMIFISRTH